MFTFTVLIASSAVSASESVPRKSFLADDPISQATFASLRNKICAGTWQAKGLSGEITVRFFEKARKKARFLVQDGDKERRWWAYIRIKGTEVVLRASGFERWDTYQLEEKAGVVTLSGSYDFEGKPRGTAELTCTKKTQS